MVESICPGLCYHNWVTQWVDQFLGESNLGSSNRWSNQYGIRNESREPRAQSPEPTAVTCTRPRRSLPLIPIHNGTSTAVPDERGRRWGQPRAGHGSLLSLSQLSRVPPARVPSKGSHPRGPLTQCRPNRNDESRDSSLGHLARHSKKKKKNYDICLTCHI